MLAKSILSSYSRLLVGVSLAFLAVALAGCNEKAAETAPSRPVLVATAHYEAETPERNFVGTIRPGSRRTSASASRARSPGA